MQTSEYSQSASEEYFRKVQNQSTQLNSQNSQRVSFDSPSTDSLEPVFLVGFPRSGTTLMDTILRSHSNVVVVEEEDMISQAASCLNRNLDIRAIENLEEGAIAKMRDFYFEALSKHVDQDDGQLVVDKLPLNIVQIPLIHTMFPSSKIILALRHPLDCVLSCFIQNFKMNPAMGNMTSLNRITDLYCYTMQIHENCSIRYELDSFSIRYEDLVDNFDDQTNNLLDFLGLGWEEELTRFYETARARGKIDTPSYSQVTQPLYSSSKYRWENYANELGECIPKIDYWAKKFGYDEGANSEKIEQSFE